MNQQSHKEWVAARTAEKQVAMGSLIDKAKKVVRVTAALFVGYWLFKLAPDYVIGIAPTLAFLLLALTWPEAFPEADTANALRAAVIYRWSTSRSFRAELRKAFRSGTAGTWINDHISQISQDLPDLKRLGSDFKYAAPIYKKAVRSNYVLLMVPLVLWSLLVCVTDHRLIVWTVLFAILSAMALWHVARSRAMGSLPRFVESYRRLALVLADYLKDDEHQALSAADLAARTQGGRK